MKYKLRQATSKDVDILIDWKLNNIFSYANNLDKQEIVKINDYVKNKVPKQLSDYRLIEVNNKVVGCLLVENYDDGYLLDEIYIEKEFRNKGIGSDIIKNILSVRSIVYLWVYKDNKMAFSLYSKLGFDIIHTTETRYFMKYSNKKR